MNIVQMNRGIHQIGAGEWKYEEETYREGEFSGGFQYVGDFYECVDFARDRLSSRDLTGELDKHE